jgi:hypothetical protein
MNVMNVMYSLRVLLWSMRSRCQFTSRSIHLFLSIPLFLYKPTLLLIYILTHLNSHLSHPNHQNPNSFTNLLNKYKLNLKFELPLNNLNFFSWNNWMVFIVMICVRNKNKYLHMKAKASLRFLLFKIF